MFSLNQYPPFIRHLILMIFSLIFQLIFYNFLEMSTYLTLSFYMFFIITLPIKIKKILLITISFAYGILIDIFVGSGGLYAMATTAAAFIRPFMLRLFLVKDERYRRSVPSSKVMGIGKFLLYSFAMLFVSTLVFIGTEAISFLPLIDIFLKTLLSTIVTMPFIYFAQMLIANYRVTGV